MSESLNIVIPMAGRGSRFSSAGYAQPKPLIPIFGKTLIELVIDNLRPACPHHFIFVCQREHLEAHNLRSILRRAAPNSTTLEINQVTEGAACTVLLARSLINTRQPLMVANCDQFVTTPIDLYLQQLDDRKLDGLIMTMTGSDPKWSFAKTDPKGRVTEVAEKRAISNQATVGIYNFKFGELFVSSAERMISKNLRVNNEFYVAPVYNELVSDGGHVGIYNVGQERDGMFGLGVPEDLEYFKSVFTKLNI
jgi:NDP-sugar pyrophosphorylase family protein